LAPVVGDDGDRVDKADGPDEAASSVSISLWTERLFVTC
jgi:hypothetical protein